MTKNWLFAKIIDILQKKSSLVIVFQNHYLNKILDVHPLRLCLFDTQTFDTLMQSTMALYTLYEATAKKLEFSSGKSGLATLF